MEHHDHKEHQHTMDESVRSTHDHATHESHIDDSMAQDFLKRFWIVSVLLIPLFLTSKFVLDLVGIEAGSTINYLQFLISTAIFYFSFVFYEHAYHELKSKKPGMMTLVAIAISAGYLFSAVATFSQSIDTEFYLEISTLIWILLLGHYLEAKSSSRAGNALQEVAKLLPKKAHLKKDDEIVDVEIEDLKKNDIVLIRPGEKAPADGVVIKGTSNVDESLISGESKPENKRVDDLIVAGSIILDGALEIKLRNVGENSTVGQIKILIATAQQTKPSAQKLADRAAGWLTFIAVIVALLTLLIWTFILGETVIFAVTLAITVLVIACPHALGLAIPTVSTIATSLAVKHGLFIKDMSKLETVRSIDYVVFDKTGTLTKGEFGVTDVVDVRDNEGKETTLPEKILSVSASLEEQSSHVIGMSILSYAQKNGVKTRRVENFENIAGKGITGNIDDIVYKIGNKKLAEDTSNYNEVLQQFNSLDEQGKTTVFVIKENEVIGLIALSDTIKEESYTTIQELHDLGVQVAMLTGDSEKVADYVAQKLDIDTYFAEVLPKEKYTHVQKLQKDGSSVMMVGDGVNDSPALTQADVGVAIGAGTDIAVESGDIVLTRSNPNDIVRLIVLSRKVYRKMQENLVWALGYNIVAIPAAAGVFASLGFFLSPQIGAVLMTLSSVIVVLNALSLRRIRLKSNKIIDEK